MSDPFANVRSMIIVFAMDGCPACQDFKPRFEKMIAGFQKHGVPMIWHQQNRVYTRGEIPVLLVDAASSDQSVVGLADSYQVSALPTTILFKRFTQPTKLEGALDDQQIYDLLVSATNASR